MPLFLSNDMILVGNSKSQFVVFVDPLGKAMPIKVARIYKQDHRVKIEHEGNFDFTTHQVGQVLGWMQEF